MKPLQKLAGQTLVYGMGTMVPKLLNYIILTPYFTRLFSDNIGEYGKLTELYAYIVFLMVLLTYGMETTYFRFAAKEDKKKVFSTIMFSIVSTTLIFLILVFTFSKNISEFLKFQGEEYFIKYLAGILAIETLTAIPFARLRIENKARRFAVLKILLVVSNIGLMLFFYNFLPAIGKESLLLNGEGFISARYIFLSNLISSGLIFILLIGQFRDFSFSNIDFKFLSKLYAYGLPLLIAGLAGVVNETLDRAIYKHVVGDIAKANYELGIYGANYKLASIILITVQMFRYAAEPFFFNYEKEKDSRQRYAQIMSIFVGITLAMALVIILYIDLAKYFIDSKFYEGLQIVPLIAFTYVLYGMVFNLSTWYKLSNKTLLAVIITFIGAALTLIINVLFIPSYGYYACAFGHVISYSAMVILSYVFCRIYYPIPYNVPLIGAYFLVAAGIYLIDINIEIDNLPIKYLFKTFLLAIFFIFVAWKENLFKYLKR